MSANADQGGGFGGQLRRDRAAAGLTQEDLAERSGLSVRTISDLERGRISQPRRSTVRQLTRALSCSGPQGDEAAAAGAARPAQLPADLADFTGRAVLVAELAGLLEVAGDSQGPGAVVVSAVAGAGGIGKSALAVHVAHRVASRFAGGQLYLNLRGSSAQPVAPGEALARLLRDLGADPAGVPAEEGERAARYRSLLAGRRLLILLDDARDAAQVRPLLPGTAGCAVLVTSRGSLADLESARLLDLDVLPPDEALALFTRIAGRARVAAEPGAAAEVLAACGGLPLAIRIAAARLAARPGWSVASLAVRLGDARQRLDELQAGDLAVRASFMVSYANLPPGPGRAFRMLGLAEGPDISLPAAAALLGVPRRQAEQTLELLVDAHLLQSAMPGRYRFHDLLRVYAAELASAEHDPAERDAAVRHLLSWYLHTNVAAARLIDTHRTHVTLAPAGPGVVPLAFTSYDQALAWLDAEHASLVAAVSQAARQGEHEIAWKLPVAMWDLFNLRGHLDDWIASHQTGLASTRALGDRRAEMWILNHLGVGYLQSRQLVAAVDTFRQSAAIETDNAHSTASAQLNLGFALIDLGQLDEAAQWLQESLSTFRDSGNPGGAGLALFCLGVICRLHEEFAEAIAAQLEALDALREAHYLSAEGDALLELSTVRLALGQLDEAARDCAAALKVGRSTGHRFLQAQSLAALGRAQRDLGRPEQARQHFIDAGAIYTELGDPKAAEVMADLDALSSRSGAHRSRYRSERAASAALTIEPESRSCAR